MSHEEDGETLRKRGHVVIVDRAALVEIPLENIVWQGPTDITEQDIKNMAASFMTTGQIEPIVVTQADKKGIHTGVVGRLRYEGMKYRWRNNLAGKTILCRIRRFREDLDGQIEIRSWRLVENLHRREIPAMEKARQYRELHDLMRQKHGEQATLDMLAATIEELTGNKESTKTIQHYLELTKLEPRTQEILTGEKLSLRAGLEFARVTDPKKQVKAAEDVRKQPDQYHDVQSIHWHVETLIEDERKDHQKQRLNKRADELRKEGKIVIIESPYSDMSWKEREKYQLFYGEVPEECKTGAGCPKLGIQLSGNFQQRPVCTDKKCYENMEKKQHQKETRLSREKQEKIEEEHVKVYSMPLDVRHWRIAVFGLIDSWELGQMLGRGRGSGNKDEEIWAEISKLSIEECQRLLLKKAVDEGLTSRGWGNEFFKEWIVKEFGLTPALFLKEDE
jgi:ParB-like chromosome segregation protein Spo0J